METGVSTATPNKGRFSAVAGKRLLAGADKLLNNQAKMKIAMATLPG
jgi:hypothetical protein